MERGIINKKNILNIIEAAIIICFAVFMILMVKGSDSKDIPLTLINNELLSADNGLDNNPLMDGLLSKDDTSVMNSFGYVPEEYIYYKSDVIMDVRELFIVKTSDTAEMESVQAVVENRLKTQIDNFTGYGTDQLATLEKAVLMQKGDYYFYAVGDRAADWQAVFLKLVG